MTLSISSFSEGLQVGELRYQRCRGCGAAQTLVRYACHLCGSLQLAWRTSGGLGKIYALTEVTRAPSDIYRPLMPYTLALVDLDEGFRVMGHAFRGLAIGDPVRTDFFTHENLHLLRFARESQ